MNAKNSVDPGIAPAKHSARWWLTPALLLAPLLAGAGTSPVQQNCTAVGKLVPYCGLSHPEDLEVLPGGGGVITSDMHIAQGPNGVIGLPGTLKWLDPQTGSITVLYPSKSAPQGHAGWGDPACQGEIGERLMAHGFHLSQRDDGAWQLLVVNHNQRESVEFFELAGTNGQWSLSWRGCVIPPPPNRLNDVVGLPDGSLLVTTMHRLGEVDFKQAKQKAQQGENTGFLWRWRPDQGFSEQAGSAAPRPNGVQVDKAGRYAYLNCAADGGEVRKIDLLTGTVVGTASVPHPDNASWAEDGRLLVTGAAPGANSASCFATPELPCLNAFHVYAIDPVSMNAERIFTHSGPPFGGGTIAVQYGTDLFIGSFAGDRVMAVRNLFKAGEKQHER